MPITRREWLATASALPLPQIPPRPPNVLILITDDQGYGDLSLHGNPILRTPNLDSIGTSGAQFTQFQVCPVCSPTRASLMTGRYNYRTGVVDTYLGRSMMYPDEVTMPECLAAAGYRTGIFGKWHLGDCYPLRAIDQGFQEAVVCKGGGVGQPSDPPGNSYFDPILHRNGSEKKYAGYCTDIFFTEAMKFIAKHRSQPWFCYLATNAPHDPLQVGDEFVRPFQGKGLDEATAKTYGMVANIDKNTGRLLAHLGELGLERDTILIYLTDNGPQRDRYNAGMRGRKGTVYQGGIRVPFFVRYPRLVKPGTKIDHAAAHIDVLPTILELCGVATRASQPAMDGRSLAPLLRGESAGWGDRTLFTQWHRGDEPELFRDCAARTQQYKLVNGTQLYDLAADPYEQYDMATKLPEVTARLRRQTEAWFKDVSSTRGYAPPRIDIGAPQEALTILTRQDWRGPQASWDAQGLGHWEVRVVRSGRYDFHLRMPSTATTTTASLRIGSQAREAQVGPNRSAASFRGVELPAGPARVEGSLGAGDRVWGPHYIDARKR
jgi:arylsulfatase A-like enzyme